MNILVTGGAGYVGSVLVPELIAMGHTVRVLDLFIYGDRLTGHPNLIKIKGDIRDPLMVKASLEGCDAVIHLACISNDPSFDLDPELGKSINFDCFEPLVDASVRAGIRRFIYASSSSVYGIKKEPEVIEDSLLEPLTDYSKYKAECEKVLLAHMSSTFSPVILRPATVCGYSPRQRFDLVVNIFVNQAIRNKKIEVYGGDQGRPNIHIADMVRAYVLMLQVPLELIRGRVFNVGGENLTVSQIAQTVCRELLPEKIVLTTTQSDDTRSYRINSESIQKVLGFSTRHTVQDAVRDLKNKFAEGVFEDSMTNPVYSNIKIMKEMHLK
jgi:nucleoside-diphosphate-sugar epimerase